MGTVLPIAGMLYLNNVRSITDSAGSAIGILGAARKAINQAKPSMYALLARAWGKVTYVSSDGNFYYMDDGSHLADSSGVAAGLRVEIDNLNTPINPPVLGQYATATGVVSKALVPSGTSNVVVPILQAVDTSASVVIIESQFTLSSSEVIVVDPSSPDGTIAMIPGNYTDWAVQYAVPPSHVNMALLRDCEVLRPDGGTLDGSGPAFTLGIYDPSVGNLSYPVSKTITLQSGASDGLYHTYDLGNQTLKAGDSSGSPPLALERVRTCGWTISHSQPVTSDDVS